MTTGIQRVEAASSKKTGTKRYNHQESSGFAGVLHHYLAVAGAVTPPAPREDGFEHPRQAPPPQNKVQGFEVQAMQRQVMQVNRELAQLVFSAKRK